MDDLNLEDNDKIFETEPSPSLEESESGFSSQMQKDKFLGGSSESPASSDKKTKTETYEIDGTGITVNYETLHPTEESVKKRQIARELKGIEGKPYKPAIPEGSTDEAIIFLPGWSLDARTKTAREVGQAFADAGDRKVFVVDAKPDRIINDSLYKEAEAISRLVKESGVKRITTSGYSEGGIRAVNLAVILQEHYPDIVVDGVVLMESAGLYDQGSKKGFVGNFAKDTLIDTPISLGKNLLHGDTATLAKGLKFGTDVLFGMMREIRRTNLHYPERASAQIREMINTQTHLGEVQAPVILVQGVEDHVSNPEKIVAGYKDLGRMATDEVTNEQYDPREKFLKENLFQKSPHIRMVTGEKLSNHAIPILRARQIAKDSLYLLERYRRNK